MKASIKWLKEFVEFSLSPAEIANTLTMAGLEVENIVPNSQDEDDSILEINVTPNRPDCLNIRGIAREISAILGLSLFASANPPECGKDNIASIQKVVSTRFREERAGPSIEIKDSHLCRRYSSRIIYDVKVKPSPEWLSKRLESHGFRTVNNIVDITNYVLLEMGHPLHVFDLDKLTGNRIAVKTAGSVSKFLTLDNENRTLNKDMLLIWDGDVPVAVAGVMGGLNTEVTASTVNILLESAYFNPTSIRRTSKTLNLSTDSSYRFERGTDINQVVSALDRVTGLIIEIAGGKASKITDIYPKSFRAQRISVKFKKINDTLGVKISPSKIQGMLTSLGIKNKREGQGIIVIPPSFRQDIQRDVDLIEEVARLYGYNKIPSTLPTIKMQSLYENTKWNFIKKVKDSMRKSGYSEAINYSFLNPPVLDKLKLPLDDKRRNLIKIKNPLKKEEETLRTTLIPALLENVRFNINRGEKSLQLFEVSNVFSQSGKDLPDEVLKLAAIYLKDTKASLWQGRHDGFYDLKGAAENLFIESGIRDYSFSPQDELAKADTQDFSLNEPYLHPKKSCVIRIGNQVVGFSGVLHPEVAQDFDVAPETNILDLDIEKVFSFTTCKKTFHPLPKYPYVERDIAIIVSDDITVAEVEIAIWSVNSNIIESIRLFDIYTGEPIPQGKKNLAFSIRYRAEDRTLTDSEVNELHSKIIKHLKDSLKAELRG